MLQPGISLIGRATSDVSSGMGVTLFIWVRQVATSGPAIHKGSRSSYKLYSVHIMEINGGINGVKIKPQQSTHKTGIWRVSRIRNRKKGETHLLVQILHSRN